MGFLTEILWEWMGIEISFPRQPCSFGVSLYNSFLVTEMDCLVVKYENVDKICQYIFKLTFVSFYAQ